MTVFEPVLKLDEAKIRTVFLCLGALTALIGAVMFIELMVKSGLVTRAEVESGKPATGSPKGRARACCDCRTR